MTTGRAAARRPVAVLLLGAALAVLVTADDTAPATTRVVEGVVCGSYEPLRGYRSGEPLPPGSITSCTRFPERRPQ